MKSMKYGKIMLVLRNEKRYELNITPQKHQIYGENERKTTEEQEQKKMDEQGQEPENGNLNEETSLQPWERFKKKKMQEEDIARWSECAIRGVIAFDIQSHPAGIFWRVNNQWQHIGLGQLTQQEIGHDLVNGVKGRVRRRRRRIDFIFHRAAALSGGRRRCCATCWFSPKVFI